MSNNLPPDQIIIKGDAASIYENGALLPLTVDEICNNKVAIKQLINQHNLLQIQINSLNSDVSKSKSEVEYLKTAPFISILAAIINIVASIMGGIIINKVTQTPNDAGYYWLLGMIAILMLVSSLTNIFYPYAKGWFNKAKEGTKK